MKVDGNFILIKNGEFLHFEGRFKFIGGNLRVRFSLDSIKRVLYIRNISFFNSNQEVLFTRGDLKILERKW